VIARGLCKKHWHQWRKTADEADMVRPTREERFWAKVNKSQHENGCWEWTGAKVPAGYGAFQLGGGLRKTVGAHRFSYEISVGDIPSGLFIDHICHNPACVNPDHLRAVTNQQNNENHSGPTRANTSGVRGVSWNRRLQKWHAVTSRNNKNVHLGFYERIEDAERAVIEGRKRLHTHNDADRVA